MYYLIRRAVSFLSSAKVLVLAALQGKIYLIPESFTLNFTLISSGSKTESLKPVFVTKSSRRREYIHRLAYVSSVLDFVINTVDTAQNPSPAHKNLQTLPLFNS